MIFVRTDLRISLSGAKFDEEADFDVRSAVGPPKPHQIDENLIFWSENFAPKKNSASKHRKLQIVWNARCRSFAPIGVKFERSADVRSTSVDSCFEPSTLSSHVLDAAVIRGSNYLETSLRWGSSKWDGFDGTNRFFAIFGRADFRIDVCGAKFENFHKEIDFDV